MLTVIANILELFMYIYPSTAEWALFTVMMVAQVLQFISFWALTLTLRQIAELQLKFQDTLARSNATLQEQEQESLAELTSPSNTS